jgi:hypothetical protein
MSESSPSEVLRADPGLRRVAIAMGAAVLVLGTLGVGYLRAAIEATEVLARTAPEAAAWRVIAICLVCITIVTILPLVVGIDIVRRSVRTIRAERFPPPGARVLVDTKVIRGRPARLLGLIFLGLGAVLIAVTLLPPIRAYQLLRSCPASPLNPRRRVATLFPRPSAPHVDPTRPPLRFRLTGRGGARLVGAAAVRGTDHDHFAVFHG